MLILGIVLLTALALLGAAGIIHLLDPHTGTHVRPSRYDDTEVTYGAAEYLDDEYAYNGIDDSLQRGEIQDDYMREVEELYGPQPTDEEFWAENPIDEFWARDLSVEGDGEPEYDRDAVDDLTDQYTLAFSEVGAGNESGLNRQVRTEESALGGLGAGRTEEGQSNPSPQADWMSPRSPDVAGDGQSYGLTTVPRHQFTGSRDWTPRPSYDAELVPPRIEPGRQPYVGQWTAAHVPADLPAFRPVLARATQPRVIEPDDTIAEPEAWALWFVGVIAMRDCPIEYVHAYNRHTLALTVGAA